MSLADQLLVQSPHDHNSVWRFAGNTRRLITLDELDFYHNFLGEPISTNVSAVWFDSVPIATG